MTYYADMSIDQPTEYKTKRAIFYQQGLKVYGLLPYILQRKLHAQFFSNSTSWGRVRISTGSLELNWTAIPYQQSLENVNALLDWLYADKGFEVALANPERWQDTIFAGNFGNMPPQTWYPIGKETRSGYMRVIGGNQLGRESIVALLAGGQSKDAE